MSSRHRRRPAAAQRRPGAGASVHPGRAGQAAAAARAHPGAGRDHRRAGGAAAGGRRRRLGQDRDDGRPGGLAGRQRVRRTRSRSSASPSPARPPASWRTGSAPGSTSWCAGWRQARPGRRPARRRADRRHLPLLRGPDRHRARAAAGYEPSTRLLTEAARWQLVDPLVRTYDGDMSGVDRAPEHRHRRGAGARRRARRAPGHPGRPGGLDRPVLRRGAVAGPGRVYADVRKAARPPAGPAAAAAAGAARTSSARTTVEAMDFGDQLARAARVARDHPEVGAIERDRFRVVLLDEYQDTSHAQVVLLTRCSAAGTRSPRSATRASPSTAGAAPAPAPWTGSRPSSPAPSGRAGPGAGADHELAQPAGDPRRGQRAVRAAAGGRGPGRRLRPR